MSDEKDGVYCKVCGGIIPQDTNIGSIEVEGKPTGINQLDFPRDSQSLVDIDQAGIHGDAILRDTFGRNDKGPLQLPR